MDYVFEKKNNVYNVLLTCASTQTSYGVDLSGQNTMICILCSCQNSYSNYRVLPSDTFYTIQNTCFYASNERVRVRKYE